MNRTDLDRALCCDSDCRQGRGYPIDRDPITERGHQAVALLGVCLGVWLLIALALGLL